MKKGSLFIILLILINLLGLQLSAYAEVIEIELWCSSNPQEISFAEAVVESWNHAHPEVQVRLQPLPASRSTEEALLAAIAAGTTPDIVSNLYPGAVSQFVAAGGLYPVDSFPDFFDYMEERCATSLLEQYRSEDGCFYQIPWKGNPIMLAYNAALLREAGVEPAELSTYTGFLAAAQRLTRDVDGDGRVDQWAIQLPIDPTWWQRFFDFYPLYVAATGGSTLMVDGKFEVANPEGVEVMTFLATLFSKGYAPHSTFPGDPFLYGKFALAITGPWVIPYYDSMAPEDFEYGFIPLPVPDRLKGQTVYTFGDPKNIGIFKTSKHPEVAWEFVKFMISRENDCLFLEMTSQLPFRKNLTFDPFFAEAIKSQPRLEPFFRQMHYTVGVDNNPHLIEIYDALSSEYQYAVVLGRQSPLEALQNVEEMVEDILAW